MKSNGGNRNPSGQPLPRPDDVSVARTARLLLNWREYVNRGGAGNLNLDAHPGGVSESFLTHF
jgi:hypothetical protein